MFYDFFAAKVGKATGIHPHKSSNKQPKSLSCHPKMYKSVQDGIKRDAPSTLGLGHPANKQICPGIVSSQTTRTVGKIKSAVTD